MRSNTPSSEASSAPLGARLARKRESRDAPLQLDGVYVLAGESGVSLCVAGEERHDELPVGDPGLRPCRSVSPEWPAAAQAGGRHRETRRRCLSRHSRCRAQWPGGRAGQRHQSGVPDTSPAPSSGDPKRREHDRSSPVRPRTASHTVKPTVSTDAHAYACASQREGEFTPTLPADLGDNHSLAANVKLKRFVVFLMIALVEPPPRGL